MGAMDVSEQVRVEVALDREFVQGANDAGLDLSEVMSRALRRIMGPPKDDEAERNARILAFQREHADVIASRNEMIDRDGLFGEEWRSF